MQKQKKILIVIILFLFILSNLIPLIRPRTKVLSNPLVVELNTNYFNENNTHMFFMDGNHHYSVYDKNNNFYGDYNTYRKIENKSIEINMFNNDSYGFQLVATSYKKEVFELIKPIEVPGIKISIFKEGKTRTGDISFTKNQNYYFNDYLTEIEGNKIEIDGLSVFWIQIETSEDLIKTEQDFEINFKNINNIIRNNFKINTNGVNLVEKKNRVNLADFFWNPVTYYNESENFMDENFKLYQEEILKFKSKKLNDEFLFAWGSNMYPNDKKEYWFNQKMTGLIKWIKKKDGTFKFDFTNLDKYLAWGNKMGFDKVMLTAITVTMDYTLKIFGYFDEMTGKYTEPLGEFDTDEYKTASKQLLIDLSSHYEGSIWDGNIYLIMDEPLVSSVEYWNDLLNEIDPKKVLKTMVHAGWRYVFNYDDKEQYNFLVNNIDILTFGTYAFENFGKDKEIKDKISDFVNLRIKNNFKTYIYAAASAKAPGTLIEEDYGDSKYWQVTTEILDMNGEYFWALNKWNFKDMFNIGIDEANKERFAMGDSFKIYPKIDSNGNYIPGFTWSIRMWQIINGMKLALKISYIKKENVEYFNKIYDELVYYNQDNFIMKRDEKYLWYFKGIGEIQKKHNTATANLIDIENIINEFWEENY